MNATNCTFDLLHLLTSVSYVIIILHTVHVYMYACSSSVGKGRQIRKWSTGGYFCFIVHPTMGGPENIGLTHTT